MGRDSEGIDAEQSCGDRNLSDALNTITMEVYTSGVTQRCNARDIKYKSRFRFERA